MRLPALKTRTSPPALGCGCACIKTVSWKLTVTAIVVSRPAGSFLREQRRVAAPSSRFAIACVLLAAAPTATPCFRRWRRSLPLQGSSPAPTLARRGPTPRTFAGETPCRPAGIGTGYSGKMRKAMSKVQAATKIDRKARREVRGLLSLVVWRAQAGRSVRCQAPSLTAQQEQQALPSYRPS